MWRRVLALLLAFAPVAAEARQTRGWVTDAPAANSLPLASRGAVAKVVADPRDHAVVRQAADDLRADLARVSGIARTGPVQLWVGTLGRNRAIGRLVRRGRIDVGALAGAWESFVIQVVERPAPGVPAALVVVGSDRRGTAFGAYEVSRAIGVSPWTWWADVSPPRRPELHIAAGTRRFGPPSVKYRGIFINDEDWGLAPWAATVFEPEARGIGPKTYARMFELLLRLKANTIWPAMHRITPAFNADPANAALADRYAIVMGSSHAEPMLRNNVGEWTAPAAAFNYASNPSGVARYWEARVRSHGAREAIWTLGMRGIHDSGIVGAEGPDAQRALLNRIIADQRRMLARHTTAPVERVPQVFTPYKEVLDLYRGGLALPDDVTLMWPDDNFGYIRHFPTPAEAARSGGNGVYYHLSYLGAPLSYLWLSTTPPALIAEEMGRAWDRGARAMWIANVGDLKPAELATDYFLSLAWDVGGTRATGIDGFVRKWAAANIAPDLADEVATVMAEHHRLNFERRPEHLQWYLPGQKPRPSPYTAAEADARLAAFAANVARVRALEPRVPTERRDAFFELVGYPVEAAAAANARVLHAEAHDRLRDRDLPRALGRAAAAHIADAEIATLTARYDGVAGGKWRGLLQPEPADGQWRSYRTTPAVLPATGGAAPDTRSEPAAPARAVVIEAEAAPGSWRRVDGIGRGGAIIASRSDGPARADWSVTLPPGRWRAQIELLPTYPDADGPLKLAVTVDGRTIPLSVPRATGDPAWAQGVLDNRLTLSLPDTLAAGSHAVTITATGGGVLLDRMTFTPD